MPKGPEGKPSHGLRRYGAIGSDRRGAWLQRGGRSPSRGRTPAAAGSLVAARPSTDRGSRPAVSCFSRACLLARRLIDPCIAPSPLERVSSEKVRPLVPDFSREPHFSGRNMSIFAVFVVWGLAGMCGLCREMPVPAGGREGTEQVWIGRSGSSPPPLEAE
jgi:hypothetical protein